MAPTLTEEIAAAAARLVVEEGMEYGPAKRKAAKVLGRHSVRPAEMPANEAVEDEVRAYLQLFCADTQPAELRALRAVAAQWMERLAPLRPHLAGAVWRGTATRLSTVHLQLYCDDSKQAEIFLIDLGVPYDVGSRPGPRGESVDVLTVSSPSRELDDTVTVHLTVLDHDDLRGALRPDARGLSTCGDLVALRRLMAAS
ncbi:MAG: hypothetical protein AB7U92_10905 [Piscinibacter sp.]|uniref:hypothetical protein n=1 Tax=Piscinibacter sp. TaxID=1903157 RepID=UPI003D0970D4